MTYLNHKNQTHHNRLILGPKRKRIHIYSFHPTRDPALSPCQPSHNNLTLCWCDTHGSPRSSTIYINFGSNCGFESIEYGQCQADGSKHEVSIYVQCVYRMQLPVVASTRSACRMNNTKLLFRPHNAPKVICRCLRILSWEIGANRSSRERSKYKVGYWAVDNKI